MAKSEFGTEEVADVDRHHAGGSGALRLFGADGSPCTREQIMDMISSAAAASLVPGEVALVKAMVEMAIADIFNTPRRTRMHGSGALAWIEARYGENDFLYREVTTFDGCCSVLNIDPDWLYQQVMRLYRQGLRSDRTRRRSIGRTAGTVAG